MEPCYARGTKVTSLNGKHLGALTGGSRSCGLASCSGRQLGVRWDNGKLTYCCTKGMDYDPARGWKIV